MDVHEWVIKRGGIVHRAAAADAGYDTRRVRAAARAGTVEILRQRWIVVAPIPPDLRVAALAGARVACVSAARERGWWMPPTADASLHLHVTPGSAADGIPHSFTGRVHWTRPLTPSSRYSLIESVEDCLAHVAACLGRGDALTVWESASKIERLDPGTLRLVRWKSVRARDIAEAVGGLSDSGLETIVVARLRAVGLPVRQQVVIAGRPVDALVGERLVVQTDGWEFHSSAAQRRKDIAHDAELRLRGFTVLRFSYDQIVHDWPMVERTVLRAVAAGLHLSPRAPRR
jgi:very-short-patch-repair endonuclease